MFYLKKKKKKTSEKRACNFQITQRLQKRVATRCDFHCPAGVRSLAKIARSLWCATRYNFRDASPLKYRAIEVGCYGWKYKFAVIRTRWDTAGDFSPPPLSEARRVRLSYVTRANFFARDVCGYTRVAVLVFPNISKIWATFARRPTPVHISGAACGEWRRCKEVSPWFFVGKFWITTATCVACQVADHPVVKTTPGWTDFCRNEEELVDFDCSCNFLSLSLSFFLFLCL